MSHQRTIRVARTKRAIIQLLLEYVELVVGWCSVRSVLGKSTGTKNRRLTINTGTFAVVKKCVAA